jgi:Holliday junction DNA helicase RuvA
MITQVTGRLVARELDRAEILTAGGLAYECLIPLSVFERLPAEGEWVTLHTHLAVREDGWQLYGFASPVERAVFRRLLAAKGVGPALALGILSSLSAERVVQALRERDVTTLMRAPRVGRKKAEQIILDLADALATAPDLAPTAGGEVGGDGAATARDALRALQSLGYAPAEAERALRAVAQPGGPTDVAGLVRAALARIAGG